MCEFHEYKGNGFGDNWLTDKLIYFSGTDSAGGITRGMDEMRQLDTAISASVRAFVRACACVRVCMLCTYYNIAKYVGPTFMLLLGGVGENQRSRMRHQVLHKDKRFYVPCGVLHCVQLRSCVSMFPLVILTLLRLSSMSAYITLLHCRVFWPVSRQVWEMPSAVNAGTIWHVHHPLLVKKRALSFGVSVIVGISDVHPGLCVNLCGNLRTFSRSNY